MQGIEGDDPEKNETFHFYCIFGIFGMRGVLWTKKEKNMLGSTFFALKFGTFQDFSKMSTKCCLFCDMLFNFEMSQHATVATKLLWLLSKRQSKVNTTYGQLQ